MRRLFRQKPTPAQELKDPSQEVWYTNPVLLTVLDFATFGWHSNIRDGRHAVYKRAVRTQEVRESIQRKKTEEDRAIQKLQEQYRANPERFH